MEDVCAVILAAGDGKRMKSSRPKVLCEVLFRPMIGWIKDTLAGCGIKPVCAVIAPGADEVQAALPGFSFAVQHEKKGTGHALMQALPFLEWCGKTDCLVVYGDAPFLDRESIQGAYRLHKQKGTGVTLVSAVLDDPTGYGRIVRGEGGVVTAITEQKDADEDILKIKEINAGAYWFSVGFLLRFLQKISPQNAQNEYYLTDLVAIAVQEGIPVAAYQTDNAMVALGANDRAGLLKLNETARKMVFEKLLDAGVEITATDGVIISAESEIGPDTAILPGTILKGKVKIGTGCVIGPNTKIEESTVGDGCTINASQVEYSTIGAGVRMGPFAHVRPDSVIKDRAKIGNFVEVKNSTIGEKTSVGHMTYVGDSDVGDRVNFGCGTVTVNYDGTNKFRTVIGDDCFIGCNANLVAPVILGENSYIAAGSTITDEVPKGALAIARSRQTVKENWVQKRKEQKDSEEP